MILDKISGLFAALKISSSGLAAQRRRMNAIAENLANSNTTRTEDGLPYRRKLVRFSEQLKRAEVSVAAPQAKLEPAITDRAHLNSETGASTNRIFSGVRAEIIADSKPFERIYDPSHPDADKNGYVAVPRIDVVVEMVDMISATRAFEANVTAINAAKDMTRKALEI